MNQYVGQLVLMVILLLLSGFFSASETAFSSLNRTRLKTMAEHGDKKAERAIRLSDRYDDLLSTILVGNNLVNITMAGIGSALFVRLLGDGGVSVSSAVITVVVLIFGEVTPKSLAKERPEALAKAFAPVLSPLVWLLTPINRLFGLWKNLLQKLFHDEDEPTITSDELITMVDEAEQEGDMNAEESELVRSAIEFRDLDVNDILIPRVKVEGVPDDATQEETAEAFASTGFSRLVVYKETMDHIVGIIHQKDFFERYFRKLSCAPADMMKEPVFVSENSKISDTLHMMQSTQNQMAVVADEYGGTAGIITMEDILEELVGEIWDEHDEVVQPIRMIGEDTCIAAGSAEIADLFELLDCDDEADNFEATTVNGWITEVLERLPQVGDSFTFHGWKASVTKVDGTIVDEMELQREEPEHESDEEA